MAIRALILAFGLLWSAPSQAALPDCASAYAAAYSWDWGISQADWDAACRDGAKPEEILRRRQAESIKACAARFHSKAPDYKATAFCARGRSGEAALAAELGLPKGEEKSESEAAPLRPGPEFYRLVVAKGSIFPKDLGSPYPEVRALASWTYRHINLGSADFFVPVQGAGAGSCVVRPEFSSCRRLEPYRASSSLWPVALIDAGCTGLVSTQRVVWKEGGTPFLHAPEKDRWSQAKSDEMFTILAYVVDKGCD
ncbi:MAG TPA: hypothetical protein VN915_14230 [Elusimicrobiota bacterium]|nr:hypothetical protein [Elusimicrobiota bacterium]